MYSSKHHKSMRLNRTAILTILFSVVFISVCAAESSTDSVNVPVFGKVYVYNRTNTSQNVIIMISGDAGWKSGVIGFSQTFSDMNSLVIGVDILQYFKNLRLRSEDCYNVAADFVQLATDVEKKYNFAEYKPPVIMGYSSGATLVYGILAQARSGTFIGGISIGFCPDIELPKMLCEINGLTVKTDVPGKRYILQPDEELGNPWIVLNGKLDKICNYPDALDFMSKTKDAELITLPKVGHGFSKWGDFMPQWKDAYSRLIAKYEKEKPQAVNIAEVKDLPVIITNSKTPDSSAPVALLISGDGGWYGFEQQIADNLAQRGIPTVGLVGYSLGAELVPFILNRLPVDLKSKVLSAVLLSPATTTDFEIHISNMLGMGNRQNTYNTTDEIIKMQNTPTLIIFGDGEKTQLPGLLSATKVVIRKIPGDHHYKFNLPLIMQTMRENKAF